MTILLQLVCNTEWIFKVIMMDVCQHLMPYSLYRVYLWNVNWDVHHYVLCHVKCRVSSLFPVCSAFKFSILELPKSQSTNAFIVLNQISGVTKIAQFTCPIILINKRRNAASKICDHFYSFRWFDNWIKQKIFEMLNLWNRIMAFWKMEVCVAGVTPPQSDRISIMFGGGQVIVQVWPCPV